MKLFYNKDKKTLEILESNSQEYEQVKTWLERHVENYRFLPKFKFTKWDGKIKFFNNGNIRVGLYKEIFKALQQLDTKPILTNKEDFPINRDVTREKVNNFCKEFFKGYQVLDKKTNKKKTFYPYEHQIETAYQILRNRYCTAEVATSGGKTLITSIVFFYILKHINPNARLLLIVPNISLVTQFYDDIIDFNSGFFQEQKNPCDLRIHEIMSDKPRKYRGEKEPNLIISTYQSLSILENFDRDFYTSFFAVAVDEAHQAKTESFNKIMKRTIKGATYQFGVSGTFQKEETAEFLTVQSLTGPKVSSVRAKELQEKEIISPLKILQLHINHDDPDFLEKLKDIRKVKDSGRVAYSMETEYIRASEKRKTFILKILKKQTKNTLLLFNIIEYGTELFEKAKQYFIDNKINNVKFYYIDGSVKKDKRKEILKELEKDDDEIRILFATYGTLSTGVSVNNIHNIVFAESFKKEQRIIQSIGRALRLHEKKTFARVFDLVDNYIETYHYSSMTNHGKKRATMYREHNYPYSIKKFML